MSAPKETVLSVRISKEIDDILTRMKRHSGASKSTLACRALEIALPQMEQQGARVSAKNRKAIVDEVLKVVEPRLELLVQNAVEKASPKKVPKKKTGKKLRRSFGSAKPLP